MKPTRPYFLRAIYDWIVDNACTPYMAVFADAPGVEVPRDYVEDGEITLNISPGAVANLLMDNEHVSFDARFNGVSYSIVVPMSAVLGVFARENGQGMAFPEEPGYDDDGLEDGLSDVDDAQGVRPELAPVTGDELDPDPDSPPPAKGRPQLKVVK